VDEQQPPTSAAARAGPDGCRRAVVLLRWHVIGRSLRRLKGHAMPCRMLRNVCTWLTCARRRA
jgi:hypothetical protein